MARTEVFEMDEIVRQAMAKWPNVPHCYGWLALDARGEWRMRDERAQSLRLPGDRIRNPALLAFINRNYTHDDRGRWYFQNGPQRVYVNLEATPYIARTDPAHGFILHTGEPLAAIEAGWMTDAGQLLLRSGEKIAMLDDRDLAQCLPMLRIDRAAAGDENLLVWMESRGANGRLTLETGLQMVDLNPIAHDALAAHFRFDPLPLPG
jgi:hypothetical protein